MGEVARKGIEERLTRLEEEVRALRNNMNHRFDSVDKRFSDLLNVMNSRFSDLRDCLKIYFIILGIIVAIAGILVPVLVRIIA